MTADVDVETSFSKHCDVLTQVGQLIQLKGVTINVSGSCTKTIRNVATVNRSCDIDAAIADLADDLAENHQEKAKAIVRQETQTTVLDCPKDDAECKQELKVALKTHISSKCAAQSNALQSLKITGATIVCDSAKGAKIEQVADVRAMCVRGLADSAQPLDVREELEITPPAANDPARSTTYGVALMVVAGIVLAMSTIAIIVYGLAKVSRHRTSGGV